jgi:hypothetical protein
MGRPNLDPESHVAFNPVTLLDMSDKQSFSQSSYFLCRNVTCEIHIGRAGVHVQHLCEQRFYKKKVRKQKIPAEISGCYSSTFTMFIELSLIKIGSLLDKINYQNAECSLNRNRMKSVLGLNIFLGRLAQEIGVSKSAGQTASTLLKVNH